MVNCVEKIGLVIKAATDPRFRKDVKALKYAAEGYTCYAWKLCKDVGIASLLERGSTADEIVKKMKISNRKFLECILDFLVGRKVLGYKNGIYKLLKDPGEFKGKKYEFLKKHYPNSVKWTHILRKKARDTLFTKKKHFDAGFDYKDFLRLWNGIMKESPWSFRKMAIQKFCKKIKGGADILDLGCGSGTSIEQILLECKRNVNIVGIDNSTESLKVAEKRIKKLYKYVNDDVVRRNIKKIKLLKYDLTKGLPKNRKYDVVFMSLLINHIPENKREMFFKNIKSILKENGKVVVYQIVNKSKFERAAMWVMHTVPTHWEYPFKDEYLKMLSEIFNSVHCYLDGAIVVAKA